MHAPINWKDSYYLSRDRIVLTNAQIPIPGIRVLAHHLMSSAIPSLHPHYHENCFEFTVILDGAFIFRANGKNYTAAGGDVFIAYPDEVHSTDRFPMSHGEIYWLQLDISSVSRFLFLAEDAALNLTNRLQHLHRHVIKNNAPELLSLLRNAFQLAATDSNPYLIASYLVLFLNQLADSSEERHTLSREIYQALNFVYDHIDMDISLDELAACSHLSIPQFKVRFKQEVGISPRSFVNLQKIESAKAMLLEGMAKTDVALQLGFNTSSYFSAVFKKYTTLTPSEYVKQQRKKTAVSSETPK